MIEKIKLKKLLPSNELKSLKILRVIGPEWNPFMGYLPYIRNITPDYDYKKGDELDESLLKLIREFFPNSMLSENILICFMDN